MTLDEVLAQLPTPLRPLKPLVPNYLDPADWRPQRRGRQSRSPGTADRPAGWASLRAQVLRRDGGCVYCGHLPAGDRRDRLEINHLNGYRDNRPEALESVCVLCHRVLHAGRSAAIYGSLLLFRGAAVDQNTLIRLSWHMRLVHHMPDRPLMALLGLADPAPFRMDRAYLATLYGYVVEQYWLLEQPTR